MLSKKGDAPRVSAPRPLCLKWEETPDPRPGPGQYLIEVRAAGVNPVDTKRRQVERKDPGVLGWDAAECDCINDLRTA